MHACLPFHHVSHLKPASLNTERLSQGKEIQICTAKSALLWKLAHYSIINADKQFGRDWTFFNRNFKCPSIAGLLLGVSSLKYNYTLCIREKSPSNSKFSSNYSDLKTNVTSDTCFRIFQSTKASWTLLTLSSLFLLTGAAYSANTLPA